GKKREDDKLKFIGLFGLTGWEEVHSEQKGAYYRDHWPGGKLPGGTPHRAWLRGPRNRPSSRPRGFRASSRANLASAGQSNPSSRESRKLSEHISCGQPSRF